TVAFEKVDGFWIPADVAAGFDAWAQEQIDALEKYDDASMSLSDWLGGQLVTVPTAASTPPPSGRRGSSGSNVDDPYNDPYRAGSPSSSSDPYGSPDSYRTPDP